MEIYNNRGVQYFPLIYGIGSICRYMYPEYHSKNEVPEHIDFNDIIVKDSKYIYEKPYRVDVLFSKSDFKELRRIVPNDAQITREALKSDLDKEYPYITYDKVLSGDLSATVKSLPEDISLGAAILIDIAATLLDIESRCKSDSVLIHAYFANENYFKN